ncbi:MAG: hypothetical protein ACI4J4_06775, partial [Ruminiclostridium sp.]
CRTADFAAAKPPQRCAALRAAHNRISLSPGFCGGEAAAKVRRPAGGAQPHFAKPLHIPCAR